MTVRHHARKPVDAGSHAPSARPTGVRRRLARTMTRTMASYGLLEAGAHVLVAISGDRAEPDHAEPDHAPPLQIRAR